MGCFNKKGCFSNMPITYGDRAVVLLGIVDMRGDDNFSPGMHFTPISLPIRGTYNDYGSLENIDYVEANKVIEDKFKMNIEDVVDMFERFSMDCDYDKMSKEAKKYVQNLPCYFKKDRKYLQLSMVMEHEEIFDKLCNIQDWRDEIGEDFDNDVKVVSEFIEATEKNKDYISKTLADLKAAIEKSSTPEEKTERTVFYERLKNDTEMQESFLGFQVRSEVNTNIHRNLISFLPYRKYGINDSIYDANYVNRSVLLDLYKDATVLPEYRKEYVDFGCLYFAMMNLNLVFGVSNYYSQQVNYDECVRFVQGILDVMKQKKEKDDKERAEWEGE
jgi:hypothetical protein